MAHISLKGKGKSSIVISPAKTVDKGWGSGGAKGGPTWGSDAGGKGRGGDAAEWLAEMYGWDPLNLAYALMEQKGKGKGDFFSGSNAVVVGSGKPGVGKTSAKGGKLGAKIMGKTDGKGESTKRKSALHSNPELSWKTRLTQAYAQKYKVSPTRETIAYTVEQVIDGYQATVACENFEALYAGEVCQAKKLAEDAAAHEAFKAEFSDIYEMIPDELKEGTAAEQAERVKAAMEARTGTVPKKAKVLDAPAAATEDTKSKLNIGMMLLLGRSVVKGDMVYTYREEAGETTCTLTLNCFEDPVSMEGAPVQGIGKEAKRLAETEVCAVALELYQDEIAVKEIEHQAKKEAKIQAKREENCARRARKGGKGVNFIPTGKRKEAAEAEEAEEYE